MSELKDSYIKFGWQYDRLETESWYLSQLALRGAIEVDNHTLGRNDDFSHVQELVAILGKYQLDDTAHYSAIPYFPYLATWEAVKNTSEKEIRRFPELALEMKLLKMELETVPTNLDKMKYITSVLCDLCGAYRDDDDRQNPRFRYLVA